MYRRIAFIALAAVGSSTFLRADFSYEQTSKISGSMMKVMAVFSSKLREPIRSSVLVKGDRMAHINPMSSMIIDLGKETITEINHEKKTYSVTPFSVWAEALKSLDQRTQKKDGEVNLKMKTSLKETGLTRVINGINARQFIMTIEFQGTDPKTQKDATAMTMVNELWVGPDVSGYQEVREFYKRMADKLNWVPGGSAMAPAGSSQGMAEMYREAAKMQGVPVLQISRMGGIPQNPDGTQSAQAAQQQQQQQAPQVEPEKPSVGGALGKLGGRFGGLGGLGRRKQEQPPQQQQQAPAQTSSQPADGAAQGSAGPGALFEVTSELTGFSAGAVDGSKFDVPAGYKQIDSEMVKSMNRGR
jgi:hypothetical protein